MRGNIYRSGRRRTGSVLLVVGATVAFGLAVVLASASSALAKTTAIHARSVQAWSSVHVQATGAAPSHSPTVKHGPAVIARAAGHKIA
jgi:hypothetical protein